jgi:LuxR family maltose regulon positive regulatory protein
MPASLHVVLLSRRDPPLPLERWRMRGQLAELRDEDLRFSLEETAAFLNGTMGLGLSGDQIDRLDQRTEGWVGGLQLAALSLTRHADRDAFIASFDGSDRYIMDYLAAEVLRTQPPEIRRFLLRTSVVERMNGDLCRELTGLADSAEILRRLEREHLFVVGLDSTREWFRYHHLFADLLRHQLALAADERASDCHAAASVWFERRGAIAEAAEHALAAGDSARVAGIVDRHGWDMILGGHSKQLLTWLQQVPESVLMADAKRLSTALWCEYVRIGCIRQPWRKRIEELTGGDGEATPGEARAIRAELSLLDAIEAARSSRRFGEAIDLASASLRDPVARDVAWVRICAYPVVAGCSHAIGELDVAARAYDDSIRAALQYGFVTMFFVSSVGRARLTAALGGPAEGRSAIASARATAVERGWDGLPFMSWLTCGLGEMHYEEDALDESAAAYEETIRLSRNEPSTVRHVAVAGLARVRRAQGKPEEAEALLRDIEGTAYVWPLMPVLPDFDMELARLALSRGMTDAAGTIVDARGLATEPGEAGATDSEILLLGRYLIHRHRHGEAIDLLTRRLEHAEARKGVDFAIRARTDLALARLHQGEWRQALDQIAAALERAEPLGYRRVFIDIPAEAGDLFDRLLRQGIEDPRLRAFVESIVERRGAAGTGPSDARSREPLSPGERRVLQLVVAGLSNKELGERLFISQNTVKTHLRHIYAKTGARNRAEAIGYAHAFGLAEGQNHPLNHPEGR